MKTRGIFAALFFAQIVGLAAETAADNGAAIGLMGTFTGDSSTPGINCRDGFEVARHLFAPGDKLNGHQLKFIYGDTKGIPAIAVTEFQRLNTVESVTAVINQRSQTTAAINPLALQSGIALLAIAGQSDVLDINPNAFRFWPSAKLEAQKLSELLKSQNIKRIALVSAEEEYTLSLRESLRSELSAREIDPVLDATLLPADTEFSSVAAKLRTINPEYVLCNLTIPQNGAFVKKIRESGVKSRIVGNYWVSLPDFVSAAGAAQAEGVTVAAIDPDPQWLGDAYEQAGVAGPPTAVAETCLTALAGLLTAMKNTDNPSDRASVIKSLHRLTRIELPGEAIPFIDREAQFNLNLRTFKDGRLISQ